MSTTAWLTTGNSVIQAFDNTSGNVAIGNSTASSKLDVYGDVTVRSNLRVVAVSTLGSNVALSNSSGIANLYSSNVFVGINNSTPVCALDVNGSIRANSQSQLLNKIISVYDSINDPPGSSVTHWGFGLSPAFTLRYQVPTAGAHGFYVNNTEAMRIHNNNNIGINNSAPSYSLDVLNGTGARIQNNAGGAGRATLTLQTSNFSALVLQQDSSGGAVLQNWQNQPFRFYNSTTELVTISNNGYVGINDTTPACQLDVGGAAHASYLGLDSGLFLGGLSNTLSTGSSTGSNQLLMYTNATSSNTYISLVSTGGAGNTVGLNFNPDYSRAGGVAAKIVATNDANGSPYLSFFTGSNASATTERLRIAGSNGFVGINTQSPAYQLDVNGSMNVSGQIINTGITNISNAVMFSSNTSVYGSNTSYWASNTAYWASNRAYSSVWNSSADKLVKSLDTSNPLTMTVGWQNAYTTNNAYQIVLESTQNIATQTAFGSKRKRLSIAVSNSAVSYDESADTWGVPAAFTTLNLVATASNSTSVTLSSSTNWVTTGVMSHVLGFEIISAPVSANIGSISLS